MATMRKNEPWTILSRVILMLLLVVDTNVQAESSYDGDVKGCIAVIRLKIKTVKIYAFNQA